MKRVTIAVLAGAALLFAGASAEAQAAGFSGRGASGGAHVSHGGFHHGSHTTFVVRGGFHYGWPGPYYWPGYYYAPAYYYAAPAYYYENAAPAPAAPPAAYWYFCAPLGAYYPYVQQCPAAWQLVSPSPY
jgi:hypothetical protein